MKPISREIFDKFVGTMKFSTEVDFDFIYLAYCTCVENIDDILTVENSFEINPFELINYCIGEYIYSTSLLDKESLAKLKEDESSISSMASIALDKYLSLTMFNTKEPGIMNRFLPPISSINTYLNFMLNILNKYKYDSSQNKLVRDLLVKAIAISRCVINLLVGGYVTEAFGTWRTLHECECVLVLLTKYKKPLINEYLKFMNYGIAYKDGENDYSKYQDIFLEIKQNMASHDLKSKDMKKYIEYGWLYAVPLKDGEEPLKLNFKDGLEKLAGLSSYGNRFSMASEIVHSTPLLIYPNKDYFYYLTLLSVYESFFRLEEAFVSLFAPAVDETTKNSYLNMKTVYYKQIQNIYKREAKHFVNLTKKKA